MAKTLTIFLAADVSKLNRQLKGAQNDVTGFGSGIDGLSNKLKGMLGPALIGAGLAAGAFAVKLGVDGVKAALDDAASIDKLAQTLSNLNKAHELPEVEKAISKFERTLGVADTELRPAYDRLVRSIGDTQEATRILGIALDVSAGSGKSLDAVVQALGRAYDGNVAGLSRLGAGIDAATLKTGDMDAITNKLAQTFQGQATTAAQTMQGQLVVLQTAVDNVAEAFGTGLLNSLGDTNEGTLTLVDAMESLEPIVARIGAEAGETATSLLSIVDSLSSIAGAAPDAEEEMSGFGKVINYLNDDFPLFWNGLDTAAMLLRKLTGEAEAAPRSISATVTAAINAGNAMKGAALATASFSDALSEISDRPSKAFYSVLGQLNKGAVESNYSLDRFNKTTVETARSTGSASTSMKELNTVQDVSIDKFTKQKDAVQELNNQFANQEKEVLKAKQAISSYVSDLSADITSGFNLGAGFQVNEGKADVNKWIAGVDSEISKFEWYGNVLEAVQREGSVQLREYLQSQGLEDAAVWGQALLDNGLVKIMADKLALVQTTAGTVAQSMVPEFLKAGEDSAIETLNGLSTELSKETDRLKKIGRNIGKPIGANIKAEIAEAVAQAIKDAAAARTAALAEVSAREAAETARAVEQSTAQSLARLIRNSDNRAGRNVQPVLA